MKQAEELFHGSVTVGERGQIVIPIEARNDLGIKPGDKLLILRHPIHEGLVITKLQAMQDFLDDIQRQVQAALEEDAAKEEESK
ncbi:MAG: AbrB/MazE/SpoVT family DNA-binding domain-containing protein [Fimbriimonadaceae bacterium]|jgi:AbrB family looped-hinge helix DNA binding protein|nr:AbrB/MazE/SpoVT family DNA-binding domain-containing protein [Fimbriimonadaceae bacterium]